VTSIASMFPDVVALAGAAYSGHPALRYPVQASGFVPAGPHRCATPRSGCSRGSTC
jgi:hypothetical protein